MKRKTRKSNPPAVYAPEIQDLEFATRLHPKTNTLIAERAGNYRGGPGPEVADSADIYALFGYMSELDQEHIVVVLLDVRGRVVGWKVVHKGELAAVAASTKDILKDAILMNAAQIVVIHNHPSGDPTPSDADKDLTDAIAMQGGEFGIELLDHVIVGRQSAEGDAFDPFFSFRDENMLPELETE